MDHIATGSSDDRVELFRNTGAQMALQAALVEKDFWVCWTLNHLFDIEHIRDMLTFKGGTSLSKVFHVINRFSEDIDLAIDYAPLGFAGSRDPASPMSRSKRERLLNEMMVACREYIAGPLINALRERFTNILNDPTSWSLTISEDDPNTIEFAYPSTDINSLSYIKPVILLELGTHAEIIPSDHCMITPFAAEEFPHVFERSTCSVRTITAERTFWEKATILHAEHHRDPSKPFPRNHARHYYDLAMLSQSAVCESALNDIELLYKVVEHKKKFYYAAWARYDLAAPGTLALIPHDHRMNELQRDYNAMAVMIFSDPPRLNDILDNLAELEKQINTSTCDH